MKKLKSCPFCRKEAEMVLKVRTDEDIPNYLRGLFLEIRCTDCVKVSQVYQIIHQRAGYRGCEGYVLTSDNFENFLNVFKEGASILTEKWNNRPKKEFDLFRKNIGKREYNIHKSNNICEREESGLKASDVDDNKIEIKEKKRKTLGDHLRK